MICAGLWAQAVSTSQIKGTVQDASGLAVAGAEVKVTQTNTGLVRTAISGNDGGYVLPDLPVGPYQLEVSKSGFAKYVQSGIVLQVASNPTIDVTLKVGSVSEQVQVQADAAMVETQNTGVGQVIDSKRVQDLPLIGRQITDLIVLSGAATPGSDPNQISSRNYPNTQAYSVAGGLASGTTYVLDGSMHNDVYTNANLPLPFPDAMQEFKVETSALPAQYGMHSAAAVNAVTKSGSNQLHGDAFEFVRNYRFNARNFFATRRDTLKRNQFGGTLGGPIKKNKLFFFGAYQGTRTRQDPNDIVTFVPTTAMLEGDFSVFASTVCQRAPITLHDGPNGAPFSPTNHISPSKFSTPAINIAKQLPSSPDPCGRVTYGSRVLDNEHFGVAKADYQLSANHSIFVRYLGTSDVQPVPYTFGKNLLTTGGAANSAGFDDLDQSLTFGDTYVITPNLVNSFRATADRTAIARIGAQFFGPNDVGINVFSYLPKFTSVSVTGGFTVGNNLGTDATYRTTTLQVGDDISVIRGAHQMAFGANLAHWNSNTYARVLAMGVISFNGGWTGLGISDFFTGNIFQYTQAAPNTLFVRDWYFGLYGQDTWKVRPNLTVSLGLRWEPFFPMNFGSGIVYHFDQAAFVNGTKTTQFKNAPPGLFYPGDRGFPDRTGLNKQWKQFEPRVGIVWDPKGNGRTSIRASYGTFYDTIPAQYNLNTETAPPWGARTTLTSPPGGLANPFQGLQNPFPLTFDANAAFSLNGTFNTFSYDTHMTYVQQWNFSIQQQLGSSWLVSASYLGNEMVHLLGARELNPAVFGPGATPTNTNQRRLFNQLNPAFGKFFGFTDTWDDGGTGSYNGMLLSVQRRLSKGVTMFANYTWSHCISDPVNTLPNSGAGGGQVYLFSNNRALDRGNCNTSATDKRHVANMTAVAEMPRFSEKWMDILASGWRASAAVTMASGGFFTVVTGVDNALTGVDAATQRPNLVLPNIYGDGSPGNYLVRAAFKPPQDGTYGNLGVATARGPGNLNFNMGVARSFRFRERHTLEIRGEAQNVLNRANFGAPSLALNSNTFGQITTLAAGQLGNARIMQFAFKYLF